MNNIWYGQDIIYSKALPKIRDIIARKPSVEQNLFYLVYMLHTHVHTLSMSIQGKRHFLLPNLMHDGITSLIEGKLKQCKQKNLKQEFNELQK